MFGSSQLSPVDAQVVMSEGDRDKWGEQGEKHIQLGLLFWLFIWGFKVS